MNKEITIYELLGLIKEGKEPKRIKVDDVIYFYNSTKKDYKSEIDEPFFLFNDYVDIKSELDKIVEIIEEDEDIELLDVALLSQSDNWLWCPSKDDFAKDIELNAYIIGNIRENTLNFQRKLNEVIKEVNKLRKENNNG